MAKRKNRDQSWHEPPEGVAAAPSSAGRLAGRARLAGGRLGGAVTALRARVRPAWQVTTPTGRAALFIAIAAWVLGIRLGWEELFLLAACCVLALLIAVGFVIGRPSLDIAIELDPARVSVGDRKSVV